MPGHTLVRSHMPVTLCPKSFDQCSSLSRHMRTHSCMKPFKCESFAKSFSNIGNLTQHVIIWHPETKLYACHVCRKTFVSRSHLSLHKRTRKKSCKKSSLLLHVS